MSQSLNLTQSQQLVMTPQLQQAIKLLQLNNMELSEFVEAEMEHNPLLEKEDRQNDHEGDAGTDSGAEQSAAENSQDTNEDTPGKDEGTDAIEESFQSSADEYDVTSSVDYGSGGNAKFEQADDRFENRMESEHSLREHLSQQLMVACNDPRDRMIGGLLIDQLDESGYLRFDTAALAEKLKCSEERINSLLTIMRGFDPTGIFASDLADCLTLQLCERGELDEPMSKLLDHIDMLGSYDYEKLATACGVNTTYLQDMIEEIRTLNPKPAGEWDHLVVQTAIPDVLMKKLPKNLGGGWKVELNTDTLPRVLVNQEYYTQVSAGVKSKEDREYITSKLHSANWLVKALDQRAQTILKVASEIVEQQSAFFLYGIEFLKPLTLKDISTEIEMHESTVSRVTTGKYIATPRGLFELKYFFSTALESASGLAHSAQSIKARIKTLTDEEDPKKILSDDKIVEILKGEDIDIARRTVAKYREALNIPSSVQRRKLKKNIT